MKIGLVLAGAMVKGAYYIGALRALSEYVPTEDIVCISAASVGTISAQAYVTNQLDRGEKMWYELCGNSKSVFLTKVLQSATLQRCIKELSAKPDPHNRTFYTSLLNFTQMTVCYQNLNGLPSDEVGEYIKASVAFPIYNDPVMIKNERFLDGGFVDNIPVHPMAAHDLDYIICFYFDDVSYKFEDAAFDDKIIKLTFPNMGKIREGLILRQDGIDKMITEGYRQTKKILRMVFSNGYDDLDTIYRYIADQNANSTAKWRFTSDLVITNINNLTKRFTKRKIM